MSMNNLARNLRYDLAKCILCCYLQTGFLTIQYFCAFEALWQSHFLGRVEIT